MAGHYSLSCLHKQSKARPGHAASAQLLPSASKEATSESPESAAGRSDSAALSRIKRKYMAR